jgi:hypothetical protein
MKLQLDIQYSVKGQIPLVIDTVPLPMIILTLVIRKTKLFTFPNATLNCVVLKELRK